MNAEHRVNCPVCGDTDRGDPRAQTCEICEGRGWIARNVPDYVEMRRLLFEMCAALSLLDDAEGRGDHYLVGEARERFWQDYWQLREAAGDPLTAKS